MMTQDELNSKIEEVFLENKIGIPESLSYGAFRRIALYFYNEGKKDLLEEMNKDAGHIPFVLSDSPMY